MRPSVDNQTFVLMTTYHLIIDKIFCCAIQHDRFHESCLDYDMILLLRNPELEPQRYSLFRLREAKYQFS